jgi:hypothetical protein
MVSLSPKACCIPDLCMPIVVMLGSYYTYDISGGFRRFADIRHGFVKHRNHADSIVKAANRSS